MLLLLLLAQHQLITICHIPYPNQLLRVRNNYFNSPNVTVE